jgi:hypothetical protein
MDLGMLSLGDVDEERKERLAVIWLQSDAENLHVSNLVVGQSMPELVFLFSSERVSRMDKSSDSGPRVSICRIDMAVIASGMKKWKMWTAST